MGSNHCCVQTEHLDFVCNCFSNDKNVKNQMVVRDISSKWIWSPGHESTLIDCLANSNYNIPMDIIPLIKDHCFSANHDYYISKPTVCNEKYYTKMNQLLQKQLCSQWYLYQFSALQSLSIALIGQNKTNRQKIFDGFSIYISTYLPALQLSGYDGMNVQTVRRTMLVNKCPISINLLNIEENSMESDHVHVDIYLVLMDEKDNVNKINKIMERLTNNKSKCKTFILGKIGQVKKSETDQLCRKYNMSCIDISLNSDESLHDLFTLALKYYWFCML